MEHYGLDVPKSSIRAMVNDHCRRIGSYAVSPVRVLPESGAEEIVVEIDGSMIATVEHPAQREGRDLRKAKEIKWREYKLCAAREQGCAKSFYGGGFEEPEDAGIKAANCASKARWSSGTYIHGVGAPMDQGSVRLPVRLPQPLPAGLLPPQRMPGRSDQLHYEYALERELPIGSGIIESAHRHLLQRRLKDPGAWILENAENIAAARILGANEGLDDYWRRPSGQKAA